MKSVDLRHVAARTGQRLVLTWKLIQSRPLLVRADPGYRAQMYKLQARAGSPCHVSGNSIRACDGLSLRSEEGYGTCPDVGV